MLLRLTAVKPVWQAVEGEGKGQKERGSIVGKEEETACQDAIVFLFFFRPPDERKNPDWSGFAKSRPAARWPSPDFPQLFCPAVNPGTCTDLHRVWACKMDDDEFQFVYHLII